MTAPTILVVESKRDLGQVLSAAVSSDYAVVELRTSEEALEFIGRILPDLILLHENSRALDVVELSREVRLGSNIPVVIVARKGRSQKHKLLAFDSGADDYVTTPVEVQELVARIRVLLRRSVPERSLSLFATGDLTINFESRKIKIRDRAIHLAPKAYDLLRYLVANRGRTVPYQALIDVVWRRAPGNHQKSLRVVVNQLRKRIEIDPERPQYILTEPWIGYRFQPVADERQHILAETNTSAA
jgi:two-component system, OmpR family, KDP operon response regulator KdpE